VFVDTITARTLPPAAVWRNAVTFNILCITLRQALHAARFFFFTVIIRVNHLCKHAARASPAVDCSQWMNSHSRSIDFPIPSVYSYTRFCTQRSLLRDPSDKIFSSLHNNIHPEIGWAIRKRDGDANLFKVFEIFLPKGNVLRKNFRFTMESKKRF